MFSCVFLEKVPPPCQSCNPRAFVLVGPYFGTCRLQQAILLGSYLFASSWLRSCGEAAAWQLPAISPTSMR